MPFAVLKVCTMWIKTKKPSAVGVRARRNG